MVMDVSCILTISLLGCDRDTVLELLQDVTTRRDWVKGTWDLSILFLTTRYASTIISKSLT